MRRVLWRGSLVLAMGLLALSTPRQVSGSSTPFMCGPYCVFGSSCGVPEIADLCGSVCSTSSGACEPGGRR